MNWHNVVIRIWFVANQLHARNEVYTLLTIIGFGLECEINIFLFRTLPAELSTWFHDRESLRISASDYTFGPRLYNSRMMIRKGILSCKRKNTCKIRIRVSRGILWTVAGHVDVAWHLRRERQFMELSIPPSSELTEFELRTDFLYENDASTIRKSRIDRNVHNQKHQMRDSPKLDDWTWSWWQCHPSKIWRENCLSQSIFTSDFPCIQVPHTYEERFKVLRFLDCTHFAFVLTTIKLFNAWKHAMPRTTSCM